MAWVTAFTSLLVAVNIAQGDACNAEGPRETKVQTQGANAVVACDECRWTSPEGAAYDLSHLCEKGLYTVKMENPRYAALTFGVCQSVPCGEAVDSRSCILVPGNKETCTGRTFAFDQLEKYIPSKGLRLTLHDGESCAVNKKPRITVIDLQCMPSRSRFVTDPQPLKGWEGEGADLCVYHVQFPTPHGCPVRPNKYTHLMPVITAVTGCVDSVPNRSTSDCHSGGGTTLTVHGLDFTAANQQPPDVTIMIGRGRCSGEKVLNEWTMECRLAAGTGERLGLHVTFQLKDDDGVPGPQEMLAITTQVSVSYKALVDYRRHFDSFVELGVGGLSEQIQQLYQRAFASRSIPGTVLKQMGIDHAKGILMYGPPGSGKTLLARTIATILRTEQVKLVNAPEIMSKYLGESEKNLRGYFDEAEKAWRELGEASDLYVIVIDEIDAICKSRGKSDASAAAAAYDSVVNQLLTKMDGLRSIHNVLVIGLTNRKELIDAALLRPGRFEVQIEIGLPDAHGRWEIFFIHTKEMREHGYLGSDVDLHELARNTSQYSGAEIAGLVRLAASYALDRKYSNEEEDEVLLLVTRGDFIQALDGMEPAHTQKQEDVLQKYLPRGFYSCGPHHDGVVLKVKALADFLLQGQGGSWLESVLLYGPRGTGKTGVAAQVASLGRFEYIKVLSASSLLRWTEDQQKDIIIDTFHDASKASTGLLVLDDLHRIVRLVHVADHLHLSHALLHTISTLMSTPLPQGHRLLVLGTLQCEEGQLQACPAGQLGLQDLFNIHLRMPHLSASDLRTLLQNMNYSRPGGVPLNLPEDTQMSLTNLLKVTDCVDGMLSTSQVLNSTAVPQQVFNACLQMVPILNSTVIEDIKLR